MEAHVLASPHESWHFFFGRRVVKKLCLTFVSSNLARRIACKKNQSCLYALHRYCKKHAWKYLLDSTVLKHWQSMNMHCPCRQKYVARVWREGERRWFWDSVIRREWWCTIRGYKHNWHHLRDDASVVKLHGVKGLRLNDCFRLVYIRLVWAGAVAAGLLIPAVCTVASTWQPADCSSPPAEQCEYY